MYLSQQRFPKIIKKRKEYLNKIITLGKNLNHSIDFTYNLENFAAIFQLYLIRRRILTSIPFLWQLSEHPNRFQQILEQCYIDINLEVAIWTSQQYIKHSKMSNVKMGLNFEKSIF